MGERGSTRTPWARLLGAGTAIGLVHTGGQIAASLGGPLYGTFLDRGLGFGMVGGVATALGLLRVLAVLGIRERRAADPTASQP